MTIKVSRVDGVEIPAAQDRRALYANWSVGLAASGDGLVAAQGTPNMTVQVAAISGLLIDDGVSFGAGKLVFESDASANVTIATSDATNPRIDLVVAQVEAVEFGDGADAFTLEAVTGTPAASPSAPAVPTRAYALAEVRVEAGITTIQANKITSRRTFTGPVGTTPTVAEITTAHAAFGTTIANIAGLSVALIADGQRAYRIMAGIRSFSSGDTDDLIGVYIREGSTKLAGMYSPRIRASATAEGGGLLSTKPFVPTAGSHTYVLSGEMVVGSGTDAHIDASAGEPSWISYEVVSG